MAHGHGELGSSFRSLTRYDDYYLSGGDLFLLVEHHVFRVHRYFFERESTYFKAKLATPASPGSTRPGTSESNAILLDDVRVHEFARFLWVFYNPKYSLYHTSVADWTAILNLAHRWVFPEVKALAVRELEKQSMPDIERVVVYQNNQVDRNFLIPCYAALCEREEPLTPAEGRRMGIDTALTIAQLREMARRSPIDCRSPTSANIRGNELHSLVRELFVIAEPIRDDDSVPQTPLGGPTLLWQGLPAAGSTRSSLQSTVQPPPAKPTAQTVTPAPTTQPQPPARTATPPLSIPPAQEPETRPLDPTPSPPPPLPEKPERPQVITNPALAKVSQQTETSRPSTPAPETPTTATGEKEKKKRKKSTKKAGAEKAAAETVPVVETGSTKPKPDDQEAGAAVATEEVAQQQQQSQEGKKEDASQVPLVDVEKTDEAVVLPDKEAGSSNGAPNVIPSTDGEKEKEKEKEEKEKGKEEGKEEKEKDKASAVTGGDDVSTDTSNTTTDPVQEVKPDHLERSHLTVQKSPLSLNKKRSDKNDFLKSPEERSMKSPSSLVNNLWNSFTSS